MPDVRVGDVVEYAINLEGDTPVIGGRFSEWVAVQYEMPVERWRMRLLWPVRTVFPDPRLTGWASEIPRRLGQ